MGQFDGLIFIFLEGYNFFFLFKQRTMSVMNNYVLLFDRMLSTISTDLKIFVLTSYKIIQKTV